MYRGRKEVHANGRIFRLETRLNFIVTYKGEQRMLQGIADYSLWYSQSEPLATNLVIIEAKGPGAICQADPQVAAYMGMVHRIREKEKKMNKVVYGVTTDGNMFRFWRIDNSSRASNDMPVAVR